MKNKQVNNNELFIAGTFLVLGFAGAIYYVLNTHDLGHSAALFIGVATALAIGLSIFPKSGLKSVTGSIVLGMLLALILSMIAFHEGLICILMASPLFLGIGASIGQIIDKSRNQGRMRLWLVLIFLPLSMEGVTEQLSFNRYETVIIDRIVALSPNQVEQKLARMPNLSQTLPVFLQLGFPTAHSYSGEGLNLGTQRCFHVPPRENLSGDVCWSIKERGTKHVLFKLVKDESKIAHWMTWQTARVEWAGTGDRQTRVMVTLKFRRKLDPAWYFSPLQRYAVSLTGDYLIGAYFEEE